MSKQTELKRRKIIISEGENPDLSPEPPWYGGKIPPPGYRKWICEVDGHYDPDNSGGCHKCGADTDMYINSNDITQMLKDLGKAHRKSKRF